MNKGKSKRLQKLSDEDSESTIVKILTFVHGLKDKPAEIYGDESFVEKNEWKNSFIASTDESHHPPIQITEAMKAAVNEENNNSTVVKKVTFVHGLKDEPIEIHGNSNSIEENNLKDSSSIEENDLKKTVITPNDDSRPPIQLREALKASLKIVKFLCKCVLCIALITLYVSHITYSWKRIDNRGCSSCSSTLKAPLSLINFITRRVLSLKSNA